MGNNTISYIYDAMGNKLRQISGEKTSNYMGNAMCDGGLSILFTGKGRTFQTQTGLNFMYEYQLKDHLGNTRESFIADSSLATPTQYKDYYPFGLSIGHPDWMIANDNGVVNVQINIGGTKVGHLREIRLLNMICHGK